MVFAKQGKPTKTVLGIVRTVTMTTSVQKIAMIIILRNVSMKLLFLVAVMAYVMKVLRNTQTVRQTVQTVVMITGLRQTALTMKLRNARILLLIISLMILKKVSRIGTFMMQKENPLPQLGV